MAAMRAFLVLSVVAALWAAVTAQSSSSSCTSVMISLSPCLNYITGNTSTPSSSCCSQLSSVVKLQPQCLCQVLNGGSSSMGININQTQAMALPGACKVETPSVSLCNNNGGGAASPTGSPTGSETPTVPSGTSNTVPSTEGDGSSDGSSLNLSLSLFFGLLFTAAYASSLSIY